MWAPGTVFGGRYTLVEQLADGTTAEAWWADDAVLGRWVVLKILHPALGANAVAATRFRGETQLVAGLRPPGTADVHHEGRAAGDPVVPYVVVQFVDRSPLGVRAAATRAMPYEQIPDIVARMLEALHARHHHPIVHRPVGPTGPVPRTLGPATHRPTRRRSRRRRAAVAALPTAAVAAAVAAAVFVLHSSADTAPEAQNGGPTVAQAPVVPSTTSADTPAPADVGAAAADPKAVPLPSPVIGPNGPVATGSSAPPAAPPPPPKGGPAPAGATTRTAGGSTGGTSRTPPGGRSASGTQRPSSPVGKPAAAAPPPPPAPVVAAVPAGCGGAGWGAITNVGDGLKVGIDTATPGAGGKVVLGGHTEYGWVAAQVGPWQNIRACNTGGLAIVPAPDSGGPASLGTATATFTNGLLTIIGAPTPGASLITSFYGTQCLTDNGPGRQLTFNYCTPGNTAQQWYVR